MKEPLVVAGTLLSRLLESLTKGIDINLDQISAGLNNKLLKLKEKYDLLKKNRKALQLSPRL